MMIASVRCEMKASTALTSWAGLSSVAVSIICRSRAAAARCTPLAIAEK